jgi:hypothetical protein
MEPQHSMVWWSADIGEKQSANCNTKRAVSAKPKNVALGIIYSHSTVIRRTNQRIRCGLYLLPGSSQKRAHRDIRTGRAASYRTVRVTPPNIHSRNWVWP